MKTKITVDFHNCIRVSAQFPLRKIAPGLLLRGQLPPEENCPLNGCSRIMGNYPNDTCFPAPPPPPKKKKRKEKENAFQMIRRLHNCPSEKWP